MTKDFVLRRIESVLGDADLIVLKGFAPEIILQFEDDFKVLDKYIYKDGRIDLNRVSDKDFLADIICLDRRAVCSVESFILFCNCVSRLDIIPKRIAVLVNNLLTMYPNPSTEDIPDFDSKDFESCVCDTPRYSAFYSLCVHEHGEQLVQYIDNYSFENPNLRIEPLIEPIKVSLTEKTCLSAKLIGQGEKVNEILSEINDTLTIARLTICWRAELLMTHTFRFLPEPLCNYSYR